MIYVEAFDCRPPADALGEEAEVAALRLRVAQLETALESNRLIGEALGLVMAEFHLSHDHAWDLLRRLSQHSNRKLVRVSADIVRDHHELLRSASPAGDVAARHGEHARPAVRHLTSVAKPACGPRPHDRDHPESP